MISCIKFCEYLKKQGISFATGIPDSLLKEFCKCLAVKFPAGNHIIAANEGGAIGLAAGHYLVTGKPALVYMQNSGQGNALNPLVSLADPDVFGIPMILLIGWRGEPGIKDEPQHVKQGKITLPLLATLGIPYQILPDNDAEMQKVVAEMINLSISNNKPAALIVKKGTFAPYEKIHGPQEGQYPLTREQAITHLIQLLPHDAAVISSTGCISRELYELREFRNDGHCRDFLTVGSMGHASQIAMGIAQHQKNMVVCIEGDGAVIMHMGALAIIGQSQLKCFKHIVLNNGAHDSVGGQPTVGLQIDLPKIAGACGYAFAASVDSIKQIDGAIEKFLNTEGSAFLEVKVALGSRSDLGRPGFPPVENKKMFMNFLREQTRGQEIQCCHYGKKGAAAFVKNFLRHRDRNSAVFLVRGKNSFSASGAEDFLKDILAGVPLTFFSDFSSNPQMDEVKNGIKLFKSRSHDLIIAVGGGSAIDVGKAINFFVSNDLAPETYFKNRKISPRQNFPMLAIPTTTGTGSEATQFATVYNGMEKHSIDGCTILPSHILLYPQFAESQTKYLKACSGFDALAHGIESYWSIQATDLSLEYSKKAIELCLKYLKIFVNTPTEESRDGMVKAAYWAGKAINIARTTAGHALSYAMTANFNLPHGHAVALTLPMILRTNTRGIPGNLNKDFSCGPVQQRLKALYSLWGNDRTAEYVAGRLEQLREEIGLAKEWFTEAGYDITQVRQTVLNGINIERLQNNPVAIDAEELARIVNGIN